METGDSTRFQGGMLGKGAPWTPCGDGQLRLRGQSPKPCSPCQGRSLPETPKGHFNTCTCTKIQKVTLGLCQQGCQGTPFLPSLLFILPSFNKYLLYTYYASSTILCAGRFFFLRDQDRHHLLPYLKPEAPLPLRP